METTHGYQISAISYAVVIVGKYSPFIYIIPSLEARRCCRGGVGKIRSTSTSEATAIQAGGRGRESEANRMLGIMASS